jgi:hypothetical protein
VEAATKQFSVVLTTLQRCLVDHKKEVKNSSSAAVNMQYGLNSQEKRKAIS